MAFFIKGLSFQGNNIKTAEIRFTKGANVVTGASDTGKSFIFSALAYVLGRTTPPKDIQESVGYTDYFLEIGLYDSERSYTLLRKKNENKVEVKECTIEKFSTSSATKTIYKTNVSLESDENISNFLLDLCGLRGKKLLLSKTKGKTQSLSFKNILQLTFVPEDRIITEGSPFYFSGQFMQMLLEQSLLSLLLTGRDFADIEPKEDNEKQEQQITGKLEYIGGQLSSLVSEREGFLSQYKSNLTEYDLPDTLSLLQVELDANIKEAKEITKIKNERIADLNRFKSEISYREGLLYRFEVLHKQYLSDQKRLEFLLEAESLSSQLGSPVCPICSSALSEDHISHLNEIENFKTSASEELRKIKLKLVDLLQAIDRLKEEESNFMEQLHIAEKNIEYLEYHLKQNFSSNIDHLNTDLKAFMGFHSQKSKIEFIDDQITKLYQEKDRLEVLLKNKEQEEDVTVLQYTTLLEYSEYVQKRLQKWNYEPLVNVVFDNTFKVFDIIISGKSRRSYGKGKRSISYSSCLLGLLDYCLDKNINFSNLIVLDSPLTTYKGKEGEDVEEGIGAELENLFFQDLANTPKNCQIIIFDNKIPNTEVQGKLNTIIFSGDNSQGRAGFFPY
ncbi:MAG TPA: AAA family ATPase [Flavisolibacter sp.]|nr:AAA family ATPase [Flavisolibacter sp.]